MLSDREIDAWLNKFDSETKGTLEHFSSLEQWTLDDDSDVQTMFSKLDELVQNTAIKLGKDDTTIEGLSWLIDVPIDDLVKLQGQVSFKRAIKLFGDVCYLDADKAQSMLALHNVSKDNQTTIASHLLTRRVLLLIRLNLVHRVFSHERHQAVIRTIQSQFDNEE